ncbi:MAG: isoprenylcysteine carboxylmethyltransferase family protein [Vicinamibacterales bacterium]
MIGSGGVGLVSAGLAVAVLTLVAVLLIMGGEALLSAFNERSLRKRGAVEPEGDVYRLMRWAYPAAFAVMAFEGAISGPAPAPILLAGLLIFGLAKGLKAWAIATLGPRWTFRVLVLRDAPLVAAGPYRWISHPNYVAVIGELIGVAATVWAPVTGVIVTIGFGWLLRARIGVEDRALGR